MAYRSCVTVLCLLNVILEVTDVFTLSIPQPRVCIIGAGYSGLGTARYMKEYGLNFTVFEATRHIGGTWRFDPHVGVDEDGLPLFTSMYKNLRTNTPRQTMEYAGYPFPEGTPSYPTGPCFYKYLQSFAKHFELMNNIQLQSLVTLVAYNGEQWELSYMKTDTKENVTELCDFMVVASGEFSSPVIPDIDRLDQYKGRVMHSHDYKDSEEFRNRRVLLVGAGASGLDLAIQLSNVTATLLHSHHLNYNQPEFSKTYKKKPDIDSFTPTGAIFVDGSAEEFDDVIFCTGYNYAHPFLDTSAGVTASKKFVLPLYKQTVNIKHPSMTFVGVSKKVINRVMDAQGQYAAALASGKFQLPTQESMLKNWLDHVYELQNMGMKIIDVNVINTMDEYFANLTDEADVTPSPPVLTKIARFNARNRLEDLLNYRDYDYKIIDDKNYERTYIPRKELPCPVDL
ncbi:senecionine N-oxygenase-like isoform X2 [Trichoplusia ni]|uniref:Flavin-containing monooxygenase n=1 Tax=Trichoplusia ni TaxID=7111 RepID=A0A7E5W3Q2_TRINI|nr:senecionine N-oxygenase-like isoform X2 [Trichoplusia ni]